MSLGLEVVRAGAGSGKTTDLCETVAQAVANGLDPSRILATTFTRKAAAELKGRVQAKLLTIGSPASAERLELAFIGTVHSVAHRLVSKFAIELGLSPHLEVFEIGTDRVLGEILSAVPKQRWNELTTLAQRLSVENLPSLLFTLIASKRGNRIDDGRFMEWMDRSGLRMCELLAPRGTRETDRVWARFQNLVEASLQALDELELDTTVDTRKSKESLRSILSSQRSWSSFAKACRLKAGKRSGADERLNSLREFASGVPSFSELHADIREFQRLLARETIALEARFGSYKSERGLVDFTDLETLLLKLLESKALSSRITAEFDLILVDEFQDTNPLQLAIFSRLQALAPRSRWVGDSRQAIYGFRDTDPRLVENVWGRVPAEKRFSLGDNYRSQHGLVKFVGELFLDCFTEDPRQVPKREKAMQNLERWILRSKNAEEDATCVARGVAELNRGGRKFGDIAIIARTNAQLRSMAVAMDRLNLPYLIENHGLFSTREGAILLAGLRLVANRFDSLAAATILHLSTDPTEETPPWLAERLRAVREDCLQKETDEVKVSKPWVNHPLLHPLEQIDFRHASPRVIVQQVIEALGLPQRVHQWGSSVRRSCNLDSAVRHAREYEESALIGKGTATLSGLILYLEGLIADEQDMRYASPGQDAVTLISYHASKGLEWPVVVLTGLGEPKQPDLWKPCVRSAGYSGDPLADRELRNWFWPFGYTPSLIPQRQRFDFLEDAATNSIEGRDELDREYTERARLLYVGCTRARDKLVFSHRGTETTNYAWLAQLSRIDQLLDPKLPPGEYPLSELDTSYVVRHIGMEGGDEQVASPRSEQRWFASFNPNDQEPFDAKGALARFHSPSMEEGTWSGGSLSTIQFARASQFLNDASHEDLGNVGNAVHSYLAALPSMIAASEELKLKIAERCKRTHQVSGQIPSEFVVAAGEEFQAWVRTHYPNTVWHTEMPVSGPRGKGGQWVGAIDLLLEQEDGSVVLIDHKCIPIRRSVCEEKAKQYAGQIGAYEEVLSQSGLVVAARWIHFPLPGVLVRL